MLALSTSWNSWKYYKASDIASEIKSIGFEQIELNFSLTSTIVEEMIELKKAGFIDVLSLHNFCPLPLGIPRKYASPDMPSLSSLDKRERASAVRHTKNTIDTAARIGAQAVILHTGRVKMRERIRDLALLKYKGNEKKFLALKGRVLAERSKKAKRFLDQTIKSLEELCSHAMERGIKIGIENRYYISEIPSHAEMKVILDLFPSPPLYYWHDVGHAQIYENLDIIPHRAFLESFSNRMLGMHLHDIEGIDDHRAPLRGSFDFTTLKPFVTAQTLKIMEPHYPATKDEIRQGKQYLEEIFEEKR